MSKSLGNVILAKHFYQKYGSNVLRYIIFNSHYNQLINLDQELIQQNLNYVQKINNLVAEFRRLLQPRTCLKAPIRKQVRVRIVA